MIFFCPLTCCTTRWRSCLIDGNTKYQIRLILSQHRKKWKNWKIANALWMIAKLRNGKMIWLKERWFAWKITSAFGNSTQFSNFSQEQSFGMFQHYAITHHGNGRMDTCLEVKFWPFLSEILDPQQIVFKSSAILEFLVNLFRNDARKSGNVAIWKSWKDHIFFSPPIHDILRTAKTAQRWHED